MSDVVRSLVRPSENLTCLLNAESAVHGANLIAVVTHLDSQLASLLIFDGQIRVVDALPVTEHLSLAVAQTEPVDSHTEQSDPGVPTEAWSAWRLTIRRNAHDPAPLVYIVRMRHTQQLQSLTAECRRLKEIAATTHPVITDFNWIQAYFLDSSSHRPDLRLRNQPLLTRLSAAAAGIHGDYAFDISIVRRDWIERTAAGQAAKTDVKHLKIRLGTFNVNGKFPSQDLYPWLRSSEHKPQSKSIELSPEDPLQEPRQSCQLTRTTDSEASMDPDILALGFQELDLSTEALIYSTTTVKEDEWLTAIFAGLGEKRALYEKLISRQLVGMLLIVIVKKSLSHCFTDVRSCDVGSGIMGFMGNKGATAIRLKFTPTVPPDPAATYRSTVLTFVNAHLAASDEMAERRNYDFQELSSRLAFSPNRPNGNYPSPSEDIYNVYQSDILFWMVHLNYRLDLPDSDVRKLLLLHASGIGSTSTLLSYDQLGATIQRNKAFSGFTEDPISHLPTYRLTPGLSRDQLGYDLKRKPAWTDRILYMVSPDVRMVQIAYRGHPEITMSDHQPVSADFDLTLVLIDQSLYENAVSALDHELAGFEDSDRNPKVKIQPSSIEFGIVTYKQAVYRELELRNGGDIPCVFRFIGNEADSRSILPSRGFVVYVAELDYIDDVIIAPSWLRIDPIVGLLRPGEATTVSLSAYVDNDAAAKLNQGSLTLEYTLILHTALGKDDFIAVSGDYQYTCFANTLDRLTRLPAPIRKLQSPGDVIPVEQVVNAPREIMRLVNWMMANVCATDPLFEYPGRELLCHVIRECLDTGDEFPQEGPDGDHHAFVAAFGSTLVALLDSLIEPVVPSRLHALCLQARDKDEAFEVLNAFPHASINVWISLTAFMHYVAKQNGSTMDSSSSTSKRAQRLASVFAPVLLRDDSTDTYPRASPIGKRDFLLLFID